MDIHSRSEPMRVRVTHASLDLDVDFAAKRLSGSVELALDRRDIGAPLVLDQQALAIRSVTGSDGTPRAFDIGTEENGLGSALTIQLAPRDAKVRIAYATTDKALALQWLEPAQTAGSQPFLFTQGQAVLTRTWIPCQDSPGVRITYDAVIRTSTDTTAVMSAERLPIERPGEFRFAMKHPIPSYLIALAVGDIAFESVSDRCGVFAEPSLVQGATRELEDTEKMIASAEKLFGPYRWGRYDLIVLPPAFPFGGMENPMLTFATPTILAGDKSLVALVAHELAHSWSGNLVTNATWRDFWLNEGFTVYFEERIMEAVYGPERALMERQLSKADLVREMAELAPRDQVLHVDLEGRHPDDGFSGVPYNKGALFLRRIEEVYGRERFDGFLRRWFDDHAFQSVTTANFVAFFERELRSSDAARAAAIDLDVWLNQPGLPPDCPNPTSPLLELVDHEIAAFAATNDPSRLNTSGWVTQQWLHFLEGVAAQLTSDQMARLDGAFHLTGSGNSEVLCVWLRLSVQCSYRPADGALESFLMRVGRRKFLEPLYKELAKSPAGLERARTIYIRARPKYHAVSAGTIDGILDWKG
ncbi:MAG: M1 family metallopeptidase [Planctomycetota bacterium]|nr:M1 family metallopeptidase [Planctomycetota bacterium]